MKNERREFKRFDVNFYISSNKLVGEGTNISRKGFGFKTDEEIIPAEDIPFDVKITKNDDEIIEIKGSARLLFSTAKENIYYNGFEFINIDPEYKNNFEKLFKYLGKD